MAYSMYLSIIVTIHEDFDECAPGLTVALGADNCHANAACTDTAGSFHLLM